MSEDTHITDCCIVGAGPAGAMMALLLARQGVAVTLLEAHRDFNRAFRGNTINPAIMQVLAELGLADRLLELRHAKVRDFTVATDDGALCFANFRRLRTAYPYVTMLPQEHFLAFILDEAQRYPHFRLELGASVEALLEDSGRIAGVRYRGPGGWNEIRAQLTVGADGRFSRVRRLAGFEPVVTSPPMDVFWFTLPRRPDDPPDLGAHFYFGPRSLVVFMDHFDHWQVGYIIAKGSYPQLRAAGLPALRRTIAALAPQFADRVDHLQDWRQGALLSVASSHLPRWHRPGLLLIGDAAHVMSPVGGVGINCAIQDAVVAANVLAGPLRAGRVSARHLRAVQRRRQWPTRIVQLVQGLTQRGVVASALQSTQPYRVPALVRLALRMPLLRDVPAYLIAFTGWPVHVQP
jgi:2-polyprenyl-6-methoxyphenol hydroxylase-like FAD-dependent oxidoreductase